MKIINLKSQNFKGIVAIDITPRDNFVVITGKNGAGKTSAMDSIWYTLQWKAGSKGTPMPIRKGEKFAEVTLTLCEDLTEEQIEQGVKPKPLFIVNRKWTSNDNTYLKVTNAEGLKYDNPQKLLDGFIGYLSFDPRKFLEMSGKEQRELLIKITGYDFASMEKKVNDIREKRRIKGQEVKLLEGAREEITIANLPEEQIDTSEISNRYDMAIGLNNKITSEEKETRDANRDIQEAKDKIKGLEDYIKLAGVANKRREEWLSKNKPIDTESIKIEIDNAHTINDQIKARERNREKDRRQNKCQGAYDKFTEEIEKNVTEMEMELKASWSKIPDQKLSLTEDGVAYDGIPLSQISYSEQLRIAIRIDMALNPKLRVIFISDYSLLDSESKETVRKMSDKEGYQVWAESVDKDAEFGFYIEDGKVKREVVEHKEKSLSDPRD